MDLDQALLGMFNAEEALRSAEGVNNPTYSSTHMMRLSQYTGAVEVILAEYERDFEEQYAAALKQRLLTEQMKVTQAEREVEIETAKLKGQIKYLTRLVGSAWRQVGVIQSRINHLIREAGTNI